MIDPPDVEIGVLELGALGGLADFFFRLAISDS